MPLYSAITRVEKSCNRIQRRLTVIFRGYRRRMQAQKESSNVKDYVELSVLDGIKQSQSIVQTGRNRNRNLVVDY